MKRAPTATNGTLGEKNKGLGGGARARAATMTKGHTKPTGAMHETPQTLMESSMERRIHKPQSPVIYTPL